MQPHVSVTGHIIFFFGLYVRNLEYTFSILLLELDIPWHLLENKVCLPNMDLKNQAFLVIQDGSFVFNKLSCLMLYPVPSYTFSVWWLT